MRRWRSTATTLLAPNRQMCNVRALEVQIGDILKYGNKVNDGCVVTQCHPYELRHESDEDFFAPRVNLDATIKIQWKGKDGLLVSQNFGGLEMLEVLRVVDQDAEKDYYFGDVVCGSDRDERDEC